MKFSNEIIKILDDLSKRIGIAVDWSNENIIPYLNELVDRFIKWDISTSIIGILIGMFICIISTCVAKHIWKNRENYAFFGDLDELITWGFLATIAVIIIGGLLIANKVCDVCKAVYLPEVRICEFIQQYIK